MFDRIMFAYDRSVKTVRLKMFLFPVRLKFSFMFSVLVSLFELARSGLDYSGDGSMNPSNQRSLGIRPISIRDFHVMNSLI